MKIVHLIRDSISFFPFRAPLPPFFPLSLKLSFTSTVTNDLDSHHTILASTRVVKIEEDGQGRRSGISLARHRVDPLVKTARPVLRFRSTIKLISAFYSIGMYKGGWTDYFLVPALDCRESRTHFFFLRAHAHTVT